MLFLLVGLFFLLHRMKLLQLWNESLGWCSMDNACAALKMMQHQISLFKLHAKRDVDASAAAEDCGDREMLHVLVWVVFKHTRSLKHWHGSGDDREKKKKKKKDRGTLGVHLSKISHLLPWFHEFHEVPGLSSIMTKISGCDLEPVHPSKPNSQHEVKYFYRDSKIFSQSQNNLTSPWFVLSLFFFNKKHHPLIFTMTLWLLCHLCWMLAGWGSWRSPTILFGAWFHRRIPWGWRGCLHFCLRRAWETNGRKRGSAFWRRMKLSIFRAIWVAFNLWWFLHYLL